MTRTAQGRIGHYLAREGMLLQCLTDQAGLSRQDAERLLFFGAVYVDRSRVTADCHLSPGQYIRVHLQPRRFPIGDIDWISTIVEDRAEFVVVCKPAGIPVHPTLDNRLENVLHQLTTALETPLFITQRLDVDVGGVIVFAKTQAFQRYFNQLLVERKVTKRYCALVNSAPKAERYVHYMKPSDRGPKTVRREALDGWLECALSVLNVRPIEADIQGLRTYEVEIDLETGRTHQIRAQLAAMGSPIVGDRLYGSPARYEIGGKTLPGIALFSTWASWPVNEEATWSCSLQPPWRAGANGTSHRS